MFKVLVGFLPWILFWTLTGTGNRPLAIVCALAASVMLVARRRLRGSKSKTLEVVALCYFLLQAILTFAVGSGFLIEYGALANYAVLAAVAFGTLAANNPFTYQYAKEDWDEEYWDDPVFIRINRTVTAVWGAIFLVNLLLTSLAIFAFPPLAPLLATWLPIAGIILGALFSAHYPGYAARQAMQEMADAKDPDELGSF